MKLLIVILIFVLVGVLTLKIESCLNETKTEDFFKKLGDVESFHYQELFLNGDSLIESKLKIGGVKSKNDIIKFLNLDASSNSVKFKHYNVERDKENTFSQEGDRFSKTYVFVADILYIQWQTW